jgi:hypothetical protein
MAYIWTPKEAHIVILDITYPIRSTYIENLEIP